MLALIDLLNAGLLKPPICFFFFFKSCICEVQQMQHSKTRCACVWLKHWFLSKAFPGSPCLKRYLQLASVHIPTSLLSGASDILHVFVRNLWRSGSYLGMWAFPRAGLLCSLFTVVFQAQHGQCSACLLIEGMAFVFQASVHPEGHLSPWTQTQEEG